jgi:hypothetical protein
MQFSWGENSVLTVRLVNCCRLVLWKGGTEGSECFVSTRSYVLLNGDVMRLSARENL